MNERKPQKKNARKVVYEIKFKSSRSPAGEVAAKICAEYLDMPTMRLARLAMQRNPKLWTNYERCRNMIRYYRGQIGDAHRAKSADKAIHCKSSRGTDAGNDIFDGLPEPIESLDVWDAVKIEGTKALLISDVHVPYHDKVALRCALQTGVEENVDCVILNGDIIDFYSISRWESDPRKRDLKREIEATKQLLGVIRTVFHDSRIYYKLGNHEERYNAFMIKRAPELLGIDAFEFASIMDLARFGITLIPSRCYGTFGKLPVLHGHEFGKSFTSPVNPARGYWLRAKSTMIGGHYHKTSSHSERSLDNSEYSTFSLGCLCHLSPEYLPMNAWNHGFAIAEIVGENGEFELHNKKVIKGRVYAA
jgi:predicted phosphodiesterase